MTWHLDTRAARMRTLVLVSTAGHCVNDLLFRQRAGSCRSRFPSWSRNHDPARPRRVLRRAVRVTAGDGVGARPPPRRALLRRRRARHRARGARALHADPLARAVRRRSTAACINIHHSFLPRFKGARPYHQAHDRGVKLIGATAHYVTSDLDEGPIIEQDVVRVDHSRTPSDARRDWARTRRAAP